MKVFLITVIITALIGSLTASFKQIGEKNDHQDNDSIGLKYLPDDPKKPTGLVERLHVPPSNLPVMKTY